jgi:outer membrane protein OmpA-like peptidoglycan-associated protein
MDVQTTEDGMISTPVHSTAASPATAGVIDLMTSLAMVFIMLFAVFVTQTSSKAQSQLQENKDDVQAALRHHLERLGLSLDPDPRDPLNLLIVVPENRLTFESGQSTLTPDAVRFLWEAIPFYAAVLCGSLQEKIDSLVIQGHTDDRGDDVYNLKLSQERSLAVMVKGLEVIEAQEPSAYQCFHEMTSASGRGRQDLIYEADHRVNREKSRRVIFKIRLRSAEQRHQVGRPSHLL